MQEEFQYITEPELFNQSSLENSKLTHNKKIEKYPVASLQLLEEAIQSKVMPSHLKDKLIRNPNKYSIFFTKFDLDCPIL